MPTRTAEATGDCVNPPAWASYNKGGLAARLRAIYSHKSKRHAGPMVQHVASFTSARASAPELIGAKFAAMGAAAVTNLSDLWTATRDIHGHHRR